MGWNEVFFMFVVVAVLYVGWYPFKCEEASF
jgi:hypothetical protein